MPACTVHHAEVQASCTVQYIMLRYRLLVCCLSRFLQLQYLQSNLVALPGKNVNGLLYCWKDMMAVPSLDFLGRQPRSVRRMWSFVQTLRVDYHILYFLFLKLNFGNEIFWNLIPCGETNSCRRFGISY